MSLKDLKLSADEIKQQSLDELAQLPIVQKQLEQAELQATQYTTELEDKYGALRLHSFAVVSLGFEKLVWKKLVN